MIYQVVGFEKDGRNVCIYGTYSNMYYAKKKLSMLLYEIDSDKKQKHERKYFQIYEIEVDG